MAHESQSDRYDKEHASWQFAGSLVGCQLRDLLAYLKSDRILRLSQRLKYPACDYAWKRLSVPGGSHVISEWNWFRGSLSRSGPC